MSARHTHNPKYIYIFYNRKSRINANATRYPYECYVKDATGNYCDEAIYTSEYYEGDDISENVRNNAESSNIEMYIKDGYVYQRTGKYATVPDITEETNVNVVDLTCMPAASTNPLKLYAVYTKTHESAMPALNVTFYNDKGMTSIRQGPYIVQFNTEVSPVPPLTYEPSPMPSFIQGERRSYQRWADCTTDEPVTNFDNITRDLNVYPQTYYYDAVTFLDTDGNEIDNDVLKDSEGNELGNNIPVFEGGTIAAMPDITQSGLNTESGTYTWANVDGTPFDATAPITGPVSLKLKFEPTPTETIKAYHEPVTSKWGNICQPKITIEEINGDPIPAGTVFEVTVELNYPADKIVGGPWTGEKLSEHASGNNLIFEIKTTNDSEKFIFEFQVSGTGANGDLDVVDVKAVKK